MAIDLVTWHGGPADGRLATCRVCSGHVRDIDGRAQVTRPEDAADLLIRELSGHDRERCLALLLDTKHRVLDTVTVSIGSVDHTFMSPREVFRDALLGDASALLLAHNHPSGDPQPSSDDEAVTRRLASAGELVGVALLDHLVVGGSRWVSLARRGVL